MLYSYRSEGFIVKRFLKVFLIVTLLLAMILPTDAFAASKKTKTLYIIKVDRPDVRVRSTPDGTTSANILGTVKKGTRLFYLGQKNSAWYRVATEYGARGYVYKGYVSYYGAVSLNTVYEAKTGTKLYKKANTRGGTNGSLKKGQYVVVYAVGNGWAYVKTISGKSGYLPVSALKKAD